MSETNDSGANLIQELNLIFDIYTSELKAWRLGNGKGAYLLDSDMFDVVIKLLDKSDKIKKLNVVDGEGEVKKDLKVISNIQDVILNGKK